MTEAPAPADLEACAVLDDLLARLPTPQREVFVAVAIEGLHAPEVAEALGLPVNTVYSRVRLARARLCELVQDDDGGGR